MATLQTRPCFASNTHVESPSPSTEARGANLNPALADAKQTPLWVLWKDRQGDRRRDCVLKQAPKSLRPTPSPLA